VKLLRMLGARPDEAIARREILDHLFGPATPTNSRTLDNLVAQLRRVLEPDSRHPRTCTRCAASATDSRPDRQRGPIDPEPAAIPTARGPDAPFLVAARGGTPSRRPLWIMRQAGRYLPEYRAMRERYTFLELCHDAALAAEVTMQPLRRFDLDAAILFTDLLIPLEPMGIGLEYTPGPGAEAHGRARR
jgi:hypothetical protein